MSAKDPNSTILDVMIDLPEAVATMSKAVKERKKKATSYEAGKLRIQFSASVLKRQREFMTILRTSRGIPLNIEEQVTANDPLAILASVNIDAFQGSDRAEYVLQLVKNHYKTEELEAMNDSFTLAMTMENEFLFEAPSAEASKEDVEDDEDTPEWLKTAQASLMFKLPPLTRNDNVLEARLRQLNHLLEKAGLEFSLRFRETINGAWSDAINKLGKRAVVETDAAGFQPK